MKFCATLWTLNGYPDPSAELTRAQKIELIAKSGFDGIHDSLQTNEILQARSLGLDVIGRLDGRFEHSWQDGLQRQTDHGVGLFNVHLALHDTSTEEAARRAFQIFTEAQNLKVRVQFETHRDTATETPEKYDDLRREFTALTSEKLPTTWDHSHFAVMKHILPEDCSTRLLIWPEEIQDSQLFHCRPFSSQHVQVPVTDGRDNLTPEFVDYLKFAGDLLSLWQQGPTPRPTLWICPEMGTRAEGYHVSINPPPWPDAIRCMNEIRTLLQ